MKVKRHPIILNFLIMSAVSVTLRTSDVFFGAYTSAKLGLDGVGLYSMILSVYSFAITLASSGLNLTVTRAVAKAASGKNREDMKRCVILCCVFGLVLGSAAASLLYIFSGNIAVLFIKNPVAAVSLKILALSLPFMALSSCMRGYLVASGKTSITVVGDIAEQVSQIVSSVLIISVNLSPSLEFSCAALSSGAVVSEITVFIYFAFACVIGRKIKFDFRIFSSDVKAPLKEILAVCIPSALSYYLRSAIVAAENLLIPHGLNAFSSSSSVGLSQYGAVKGMALPVISFPSSLIAPLGVLLIPEISRAACEKNRFRISNLASRSLKCVIAYSIFITFSFFFFGPDLGTLLYNNDISGDYIKILAPCAPLIYLDFITDCLLKGLGEQINSLKYNTAEAVYRVVLVFFLVPRFGIAAYFFIIISGSLLNVFLSMRRLITITDIPVNPLRDIVFPAVIAFLPNYAAYTVLNLLRTGSAPLLIFVPILSSAFVFLLIYAKYARKALAVSVSATTKMPLSNRN